jgi:glyoxylate reductase
MAKPKVFICRLISEEELSMLREASDADVWEDPLPPPYDIILERSRDVEGILSLLTDRVDAGLMDASPRLKVISNMAVGYDNIDIAAATERGIPVGNTPDVLTDTTADFAFALLMAAARRLQEGIDYVRAGRWLAWGPRLLTGIDVHGATLGIIGFGRIGQAVARRAAGFDMLVLYNDPRRRPELEKPMNVAYADLNTLLRESDFITLHAELNETTRHLLNAEAFGKMKRGAVVVNTARGAMIDQRALSEALAFGRIGGAALDVTDPEPIPMGSPLLDLPNCIVVPHMASASVATRGRMARMAAANLLAGLRGERLPTCVNPEAYGKRPRG